MGKKGIIVLIIFQTHIYEFYSLGLPTHLELKHMGKNIKEV